MASPAEILNKRYGDVFLSRTKNLNIISGENNNQDGEAFSSFTGALDTGVINPVVLVALVKGDSDSKGMHLRDLNWDQVHVRSYKSWTEARSAGIELKDPEPQKPVAGALNDVKDVSMRSISETKNSKTYTFDNPKDGKITLFTTTPSLGSGGNDLPRTTTLLPALNDSNFVYIKEQ